MVEPTGHCPYLGLKQNRAIRFASPTPEHRCYVGGEPIEIPVDQASFCLSQGHVHCPLYMGLSVPTTNDIAPTVVEIPPVGAGGGIREWLATLSQRDRLIYAIMLVMLAVIVAIYLIAGLQAFLRSSSPTSGLSATLTPAATQAAVGAPTSATAPTSVPATPTDVATSTPSPQPTAEPTRPALILLPTQVPPSPTLAPTSSSAISGTTPTATSGAPPATQGPAGEPTGGQLLTLYFADATGRLYVPVQRRAAVADNQVAQAAIREMLAGPRNGLGRLLLPDAQLIGLQIADGTATVNFDRQPTSAGDNRGMYAIVFSLTHLPDIQRVQFQVNGQNIGVNGDGPIARPTLNPVNPDNLPFDVHQTEFLPLYFLSADGQHDIRIIRMVPKTAQVAEATVRQLLAGPESYGLPLQRVIPQGVELRSIRLASGTITVDFTQPFAQATDRAAAVRTLTESLTTLNGVSGVSILVEGRALGDLWGQDYAGVFGRQAINQE